MKMLEVHAAHLKGDPWLGVSVAPSDIAEIHLDRYPPEVHLHNGRIGFVYRAQVGSLEQFAILHDVPVVTRLDVWSALLEPFLDTELDDDRADQLINNLLAVGLSAEEVSTIRNFVSPWMLTWTAITWEWGHYGLYDLLHIKPRHVSSLIGCGDPLLPKSPRFDALRQWAERIAAHGAPGSRVSLPVVNTASAFYRFPSPAHPLQHRDLSKQIEAMKREVLASWASPLRHYHTEKRLLRLLDRTAGSRDHQPVLQLALWFSAAVMDHARTDNTARNVQWLRRIAAPLIAADAIHPKQVEDAVRLVECSGHPLVDLPKKDKVGRLFWDGLFDVFAMAPAMYAAQTDRIRAEWSHLSDASYQSQRSVFLDALHQLVTNRGFFFYAPISPFDEHMAWENLRREREAMP